VATEQIILEGVNKTDAAFRGVRKNLAKVETSAKNIGTSFSGLQKTLVGVGAALATGAFAKSIITTSMRFEDLRTSLKSVTGSAKEGAEAFDFITKFSTRTQFSVEDLSTAFIKLKASGIEPTEELLNTFTDTAAITTDQLGTLQAMTDLFSRTVSGGLGLEELNRLADRGVPVFRILEEQLGITRLQISEFGKTAEGAAQITAALSKGIQEGYGGATQNVLDNLSTKFSNLGIAADNAKDQIGQAGLTGALGDVVETLTEVIIENENFQQSLGRALGGVVGKFNDALVYMTENTDKLAIAFGAVAGPAVGGLLITTLTGVRKAFNLLTIAMMRNPFGLILVAVSSLIGALSVQNGLGRTVAQVSAVFDYFGGILGKVRDYIASKVASVIDFLKEKFYGFLDSLIDVYNYIADIIPGLQRFDKEARALVSDAVAPLGDAFAYTTEKAGSLLEKLQNTEAFQTAIGAGLDLAKVIEEAGNDYDVAMQKIENFNKALEGSKTQGSAFGGAYVDAMNKSTTATNNTTKATDKLDKKIEAVKNQAEAFGGAYIDSVNKSKKSLEQLTEETSMFKSYSDGFIGEMKNQMNVFEQLGQAGANAFNSMADGLTQFVMTGKFNFKQFANSVISDLVRIAAKQAIVFALKKAIGFFGFGIPGLADGGPAKAGKPYVVGEEGPELFVPNSSGNVISNQDLQKTSGSRVGGKEVTVNFNVTAMDAESFQGKLAEQRDTIVSIINEAVTDTGRAPITA